MMEICPLGSGSSGNCYWIGGKEGALLLDAGFSLKETRARMARAGLDPARLRGILITHEHSDHMRGAGPISRALKLPVFINLLTFGKIQSIIGKVYQVEHFENGTSFMVDGITAHPFTTSHDCADPSAFVFETDGVKAGVMTDTGMVTQLARQLLKGLDYLVLESNHDYNMLMAGPYPWHLKKRISSRQGHLSNSDCAGFLSQLVHPGLQGVTLAHLSETNNNPDLALLEASNALGPNAAVQAAGQHEPMGVIAVE